MKSHEKIRQIEIAINNAKLALVYLREARRGALKVHEDERVTRFQAGIARSHLREADDALLYLADPHRPRMKS